MAGRVCYVNSVITASLIHSMTIFLWPSFLLLKVEKAMRNFIWSGSTLSKGNATVNWIKVCSPHEEGGLNVKSLRILNRSLLVHFFWKFTTSIYEGNAFINKRLIKTDGSIRNSVSSSIRLGLNRSWAKIKANFRWLCGLPSGVSFWHDNWLGYIISDRIGKPVFLKHFYPFVVSDYFINGISFLEETFCSVYPDIVTNILSHNLLASSVDKRVWEKSLHGDLSAKLSYFITNNHFPKVNWGSWIWKSFIPPARSVMFWKAIHNKLLTWRVLRGWGYEGPSYCCSCHNNEEDLDHFLIYCPFCNFLLSSICLAFGITDIHFNYFNSMVLQAMSFKSSPQVMNVWNYAIITYVWLIWFIRNQIIFEDKVFTSLDVQIRFWAHMRELNLAIMVTWSIRMMAVFWLRLVSIEKSEPINSRFSSNG